MPSVYVRNKRAVFKGAHPPRHLPHAKGKQRRDLRAIARRRLVDKCNRAASKPEKVPSSHCRPRG